MNRIMPVVNSLIYIDDEGEQQSVTVSYREKGAEEVPTPDVMPSVVVQPLNEGYAVLVLTETVEHQNQIREQIVGQFNYTDSKNEKGDLQLAEVKTGKHGIAPFTEFRIARVVG